MCRSTSEGGRRCPGSSRAGSSPPADGKTRIEVHTSKRSYSVIGGDSKVAWLPGEKVVSMDVIDPAPRPAPGRLSDDDRAYLGRVAELDRREAAGESITDIMAAERRQVLDRQIEEIQREAQQAALEERRGWL